MPSAGVGRFVLLDDVQLEHFAAFAVAHEDGVTLYDAVRRVEWGSDDGRATARCVCCSAVDVGKCRREVEMEVVVADAALPYLPSPVSNGPCISPHHPRLLLRRSTRHPPT
jgi:hypothetical protein